MTKSDALIRVVLGPCRGNIRPLVCAIDCLIQQSFAIGLPAEDVLVTKEIYTEVAKRLCKKCDAKTLDAVTKRIERLANKCWDQGDRAELRKIIGRELTVRPTPREILIYFAAYSYYGIPYYQAVEAQLAALF